MGLFGKPAKIGWHIAIKQGRGRGDNPGKWRWSLHDADGKTAALALPSGHPSAEEAELDAIRVLNALGSRGIDIRVERSGDEDA